MAPAPPLGISLTDASITGTLGRADRTGVCTSIERPTHHPPAVPDKPSVVIPQHERSAFVGSDRPNVSPPVIQGKHSLLTKPTHERKPSYGSEPSHNRNPSGGSPSATGITPVLPELPRSPRMKPPDRPPQPSKGDSRGGSLERGLGKPELPPHPSQVALDRQQRAGSGRPPRPPSPHQDNKKSGAGKHVETNKPENVTAPLADHDEDIDPVKEETRL